MQRRPAWTSKLTPSIMRRSPAANTTFSRRKGNKLEPMRNPIRPSSIATLSGFLHNISRRVESEYDRQQYEPQPQGERKIALARLERDGGGHHARDPVDVAADNHHCTNLGGGAAESRENDGDQRVAHAQYHRHGDAKFGLAKG